MSVCGVASFFLRGYRKGGPIQNAAKRGIYCGKEIGFGNKVSHSNRKSRRTWKPNAGWKRFTSDILGEELRIKVTAHAVKCIKKNGGLDNFLLTRPWLIRDSEYGQALRQRIIKTQQDRERNAILHYLGIKPPATPQQ